MNPFCLSNVSQNLTSEELLKGSFGIEWKSLRAHSDGKLSLRPHPSVFGNKSSNPFITTDFSESQIEIITPTFDSIDEAYEVFTLLSDLVNTSLPEDECLWFQSLPCILPYSDKIPIAKYDETGKDNENYRKELARKYGVQKQLISGVHFNFSFKEDIIKKLYAKTKTNYTYKEFKNEVYLKIARNYLRYVWLIIYLTGCSVGAHKTFSPECIHLMDKKDFKGSFYSKNGPSFRNASCGYKNKKHLHPSYKTVEHFTHDVQNYINEGILSKPKELYTQIRLKPKNPLDLLESLKKDGIEYIEIRTLDINPFYKCGMPKIDMKFLHLFLIYMLIKDESDYINWQEESIINEERSAERAYDDEMRLIKDGNKITLKEWALELIDEMDYVLNQLNINEHSLLNQMKSRIENPHLTYGKKLLKMIEKEGYINSQMRLFKNNKKSSENSLKQNELTEKYAPVALAGK